MNIDIKNVVFKNHWVLGYKNMQKLLRIIFKSDLQISSNRLGCVKKMTEMNYTYAYLC